MALIGHWRCLLDTMAIVLNFHSDPLKATPKRPFLDTKLTMKWARRLEEAHTLLQVMRICFAVKRGLNCVLLLVPMLLLLVVKCVAHPRA